MRACQAAAPGARRDGGWQQRWSPVVRAVGEAVTPRSSGSSWVGTADMGDLSIIEEFLSLDVVMASASSP
jgi:hypothetical protein